MLQLALTGSLIVRICLQVSLLAVVVVRRRRPGPIVTVVVMRLVSATEDVLNTAISGGLVILLILGLLRLSGGPCR